MFRAPITCGKNFEIRERFPVLENLWNFVSSEILGTLRVVARGLLFVAVDSKSFICVNLLILVNQC